MAKGRARRCPPGGGINLLFAASLFGALAVLCAGAQAPSLVDIAASATPAQVEPGARPNAVDDVGRTVLMLAAASNPDPAVISILVKAGAGVNARGPEGWTPLMMAAYANRNPKVTAALLAAGADPRLVSEGGETPYVYARDNTALAGTSVLGRLKAAGIGKPHATGG